MTFPLSIQYSTPVPQQLWNMTYSKYIADGALEPGDDTHPLWLVSDPANNAVEARAKTGNGQVAWRRTFATMPVNLFRVQRLRNSATVVQLNQFLLEDDRCVESRVLRHCSFVRLADSLFAQSLASAAGPRGRAGRATHRRRSPHCRPLVAPAHRHDTH